MVADADQDSVKVATLARLYWAAFAASMVLSLTVAVALIELPAVGGRAAEIVERSKAFIAGLFGHESVVPVAADTAVVREILHRVHPAPSLVLALIQMAAVVAISAMWFFAFTLRAARRHPASRMRSILTHSRPVLLSPLPVVIFVLAMYQAYQPAVLVMALVAILVAAEHYSGLTLQERELDEQKAQLTQQANLLKDTQEAQSKQSEALQAQAEMLSRQAQTLKDASTELSELNKSTTRLLSDAGLWQFVDAVYTAYMYAPNIRAVVRLHQIDKQWWVAASDAMAKRLAGKPATDPWKSYFDLSLRPDAAANGVTLARALQVTPARPQVCGAFVTDLPMPGSEEWRRREGDLEEPLFQDLLGLAWQLVVLNHLRAKHGDDFTVSAWVSRPLCWVHATDRKVFQVLRRVPREQSALLIIADTGGDEALCSDAEMDSARSIVAWAHDEIQRYVERGTRAEEYVFAALRYAMIKSPIYEATQLVQLEAAGAASIPRATADLRALLGHLGIDFWLQSEARASVGVNKVRDDGTLVAIAADVFARLIHDAATPIAGIQAGRVSQLTAELL